MKKVISLFIALTLIVSCGLVAHADEDFTLRNGIRFGDTLEEIVAKEKTLKQRESEPNWFDGTIAGVDDSEAGFFFDDDDKLTDMVYAFDGFGNDYKSRDDASNVYSSLYRSIVKKYGKALGNTGGNVELITGKAISRMAFTVYLLGGLDGYDADYIDYDEWVVDCTDGHVKIDLISYYYRNSDYEYNYSVDLSYHFYTDAEYQAAVDEKKAERQAVDDDI